MNDLSLQNTIQSISITNEQIGEELVQTINARELHRFLEVVNPFRNWIAVRIEKYKFVINQDFVFAAQKNAAKKGRGGHNVKEYHITLDMAKELSMVENNDRGRHARRYFIRCEKQLKQRVTTQSTSSFTATPNQNLVDEMYATQFAAEMLSVSEAGKIKMLGTVFTIHNISTNILPDYTEEKLTRSLTVLLKEHNSGITAQKANIILVNLNILELRERPTKHGTTTFKSLTDHGLKYGKNLINPNNEKETQPHYFEDTFPQLLEIIQKASKRHKGFNL